MNETSPQAIADGIALMFWLFVGLLAFLAVAGIVQRFVEPRDRRGPFAHQATVTRARQQMASEVNAQ